MDASTPRDALVGVQQQAIAAGNNALYDITNASMIIYKRVCQDVVKCLQIIPTVLFCTEFMKKLSAQHGILSCLQTCLCTTSVSV